MRSTMSAVAGGCVLLGALTPAPATSSAAGEWMAQPRPLVSPAGETSAQPQLSVSPRGVLLSWIEQADGVATLKYAERTNGAWSAVRPAASGRDWFVNWADVPSVVRLNSGVLVAHWLQKSGTGTYAYDVRLSQSRDDGKTWSPSVLPHHDGTKTEHGFASLFELPGDRLGLVWLDGRETGGGHGGHGGGAMSLRFGEFDRQFKQTADMAVDRRVCDCCPTAAAMTAEGPIVAFRDRDTDEVRDIFVARYVDGRWTEPAAAHPDGWKINACPVNGPMLSASGRDVVLGWFTVKNEDPQAYAAFSTDAGRAFGTPIRLDDGSSLGRVDVELLPDGSAAASYIEHSDRRARFNVRRIDRSTARSPAVTIATLEASRASGYPRIARYRDELVFAWNERGKVETAAAKLLIQK